MLTKHSSNQELKVAYGSLLGQGKTIIYATEQSAKNPNRITLFMAQEVNGSNASAAQELLLGWGKRTVRAVFSADKAICTSKGFKAGSIMPFDIQVEEKTSPAYDGQEAKVNPSTSEVITFEGQPVYEHATLVPVGQGGVKKLERQTVTAGLRQATAADLK